jgi:hypothetical protein
MNTNNIIFSKHSYEYLYTLIDISRFSYYIGIKSNNPVRIAISLLSAGNKKPNWESKVIITNRLFKLGLDQEKVNILFAFIDRLKPLNNEELIKFEEYFDKYYKEESPMILTSFEERGIKKGIKEGIQKGIRKGKSLGLVEERKAVIRKMAAKKYDLHEIAEITGESIEKIKETIKK